MSGEGPALASKERVLRRLYEATSGGETAFASRLQAVFDLGHELLGLRVGILARVADGEYRIEQVSAPEEFGLQAGAIFPLGDTYCCSVLEADSPIGFAHAGASQWATHPAYEKFGLESYFGSPVVVRGEVFGTLNFSDPDPRSEEYTDFDGEVLRLMARWVGGEVERARAEAALEKNNEMLQMIADAQNEFIREANAQSIFDRLLSRALRLTGSEYGFIGEVLQGADGSPYLQIHAISNVAWNEETRRFFEESGPAGMVFTNLDTLFGQVMVSGEPVIANDPATDPRRGGLPEGHPELQHFLGLPIYGGDALVGMIGIANRPGGYDDRVCDQLQPFLGTCGSLVEAFRSAKKRRQVELALRDAEAKARAVLDTAAEGIIVIDADGTIESFNPAAETIFGYSAAEIIGRNVSTLMPVPHRHDHDSYIQRFVRTGVAEVIGSIRELVGCRKDGTEFPLELAISAVELGDRVLFTGIVRDITERKRVEGELRQFAQRLENRNRELSDFTRVASHDLQEPMRKLVSFSTLLAKDLGEDLDDTAARSLEFITDAAGRLQGLVEDLLILSRTGSEARPCQRVSLSGCVRGAIDRLSLRIEESGARIEVAELPEVWGDKTLLTQLYQNLISNSLKFVQDEAPSIRITCEERDGQTVFGVEDRGIGIQPEHVEQIFAPFHRLHGRARYAGTGIGLAICRKAVECHGGSIWVESEPGRGSHFRFTLGLSEANQTLL